MSLQYTLLIFEKCLISYVNKRIDGSVHFIVSFNLKLYKNFCSKCFMTSKDVKVSKRHVITNYYLLLMTDSLGLGKITFDGD